MPEVVIIDLPEFGDVGDWRRALAELEAGPQTPDVAEAILRCMAEIAELTGTEPPSLGERMQYQEGSFVFDD